MSLNWARTLLVLGAAVWLAACGRTPTGAFTVPPTADVVALDVTPATAVIPVDGTARFQAVATLSDGSRLDVTDEAAWASADVGIATVVFGEATGLSVGEVFVVATHEGFTDRALLTVTAETLTEIIVNPPFAATAVGGSVAFTAEGQWSDGSRTDVTRVVDWSSGDPSVATLEDGGLATGRGPGSTIVLAETAGVVGVAELDVTGATLIELLVEPPGPTLGIGAALELTAVGIYDDGAVVTLTDAVSWSSSAPGVVVIDDSGRIEARAAGTSEVSATYGGLVARTTVTVTAASLVEIQIDPSNATLGIGVEVTLTATGIYDDGTRVDLTDVAIWSSSVPRIASVDEEGRVAALSVGSTGIRAAFDGVVGETTVTVTPAALLEIQIDPPSPSLGIGTELEFSATGIFDDGSRADLTDSAAWRSSAAAIAVVDSSGRAQTLSAGTTQISATFDGVVGTTTLTVIEARLDRIDVSPPSVTLNAGETVALTATGHYEDGSSADLTDSVIWSTSEGGVARVSNAAGREGTVTAVGVGIAVVTATFGLVTGSATITVSPAVLVLLEVSPASAMAPMGTTVSLRATAEYSDGTSRDVTTQVTWSSSSSLVAPVSNLEGAEGVVSANTEGRATITALLDGERATSEITVTGVSLLSIAVSPANAATETGLRTYYGAAGTYSDGTVADLTTTATWTTGNSAVATISNVSGAQGQLLAEGAGSTMVNAILDGVTGSTRVTVEAPELEQIQVTPITPTLREGDQQVFQVVAIYSNGTSQNVTNRATWTSTDTSVVAFSGGFFFRSRVTAVGVGTATVRATFMGMTGEQDVSVTNAVLTSISLNPALWNTSVGSVRQYTAQALYSDGSWENVNFAATWVSTDTDVAQVTTGRFSRGRVEALAEGTATIRATYMGLSAEGTINVSAATVTAIQVTPFAPTLAAGTSRQFQAVAIFSDGSSMPVTNASIWTSSDPDVAAMSNAFFSRGLGTALEAGTSTITANYMGLSGSTTLAVTDATIDRIQVTPFIPTVPLGYGTHMVATAIYSDGSTRNVTRPGTWTSSDTDVAAVSNAGASSGNVTSIGPGMATLTAQYMGVTGSTVVTVSSATLSSISVAPGSVTMGVGDRSAFTATGHFSDMSSFDITNQVTWLSSDTDVADVSNAAGSRGEATAFSLGTAAIRAQRDALTGAATLVVE